MQVKGMSTQELIDAANEVNVKAEIDPLNQNKTRHRVKLFPNPNPEAFTKGGNRRAGEAGDAPYQRISASVFQGERRVHAVCWHGFRDFFRACFKRQPEAIFRTAMAVYDGQAGFERVYPETGYRNIGSHMYPMSACEACRCPDSGEAR